MRALQMDSPAPDSSTTHVVRTQTPTPGPGQVSINVAYAGINFMDVMTRRGDPGYAPLGWPLVPGLEVAGTVRAAGPGVCNIQVGDRVAAKLSGGGFAEVAVADSKLVAPVPDSLDLSAAAAAPLMLATAVLLLRDVAQLRAGERLFMHKVSGGVGSVVPQVAQTLGVGVRVGSVSRSSSIDAATAAGWDHVLHHDDAIEDAARRAAGGGFDVILDPTGTTSLELDLAIAAPGARIILFGNAGGTAPAALPPFSRLLGSNVGLLGFSITALARTNPDRVTDALVAGLDMLVQRQVHLPVTVIESLTDVGAIHDLLANRVGTGKYVVHVNDRSSTCDPRLAL
ncbi:quinone oxidoreductase family protein [Jatrophihabitans lederbergiae]|uniref:Zinc-binding dehydrogenase n=1 Tax=Jatrophihabitans lederbergiae TaxID=3075547 RepID=A0ABU2JH52_9ACTN|nr:zinc-binding dehydrogenase [Jatrophihabitans sp. DSM 44399]MDT0264305.1 zinc-binding dehydrogenase [Jatrophihabitans sp. DSM 44399]